MQIHSFIHDSFQEYEGQQSLVLFYRGCNLRCSYCYNLKEILGDSGINKPVKDIIDNNITPMHTAVVFLGGEPTIHKNLIEHVRYAKKNKGLKTKVYTNGLNPNSIDEMLNEEILDAISIDFKCVYDLKEILGVKIEPIMYINAVWTTIKYCQERGIDIEVRTTITEHFSEQHIAAIKKMVSDFGIENHIIQEDFRDNF